MNNVYFKLFNISVDMKNSYFSFTGDKIYDTGIVGKIPKLGYTNRKPDTLKRVRIL